MFDDKIAKLTHPHTHTIQTKRMTTGGGSNL